MESPYCLPPARPLSPSPHHSSRRMPTSLRQSSPPPVRRHCHQESAGSYAPHSPLPLRQDRTVTELPARRHTTPQPPSIRSGNTTSPLPACPDILAGIHSPAPPLPTTPRTRYRHPLLPERHPTPSHLPPFRRPQAPLEPPAPGRRRQPTLPPPNPPRPPPHSPPHESAARQRSSPPQRLPLRHTQSPFLPPSNSLQSPQTPPWPMQPRPSPSKTSS